MATDQNLIDALDAVITKANATADSSTPEELVYLGKALEAVGPASTTRFIVEIGESERARVISVGDAKIAELSSGLKTIGGESILGSGDISAGGVLQTVSYTFSGTQELSGSWSFLGSNVRVSITPKKTTSSFLIMVHLTGCINSSTTWMAELRRNGVTVDGARGDASGNRMRASLRHQPQTPLGTPMVVIHT